MSTTSFIKFNINRNLTSVQSKFPSDISYILSVYTRIHDFAESGDIPLEKSLLADIHFIINNKGIRSACFGFANIKYVE